MGKEEVGTHILDYVISMMQLNSWKESYSRGLLWRVIRDNIPKVGDKDIDNAIEYLNEEKLCVITVDVRNERTDDVITIETTPWGCKQYYTVLKQKYMRI